MGTQPEECPSRLDYSRLSDAELDEYRALLEKAYDEGTKALTPEETRRMLELARKAGFRGVGG